MTDSLKFIDLFAGAGGFSLGLHQAGMKGVLAVERDPMAFSTFKHNLIEKSKAFDWAYWLPVKNMDIRHIIDHYYDNLVSLRGEIDLVVGGPPCQGFSTAGRRVEHDERNQMFKEYVKFVDLVRPKAILFENVPGFSYKFKKNGILDKSYSSILASELTDLGYEEPKISLCDFSNFGVPQSRKRLVIFTSEKGNDLEKIQSDMNSISRNRKKVSVEEAISDLERVHGELQSTESNNYHMGLYGKPNSRYQRTMRKGSNNEIPDSHRFARHSNEVTERFGTIISLSKSETFHPRAYLNSLGLKKRNLAVLKPQIPSPTLTTLPDDYIHYKEARILTVREYARLQSFPDWFEFKGKYTTGGSSRIKEVPRYTQVANAMPPIYATLVGKSIEKLLG